MQNYFSRYKGSGRFTQEIFGKRRNNHVHRCQGPCAIWDEDIAEARIRALSWLAYGHFDAREILNAEKDMVQVLKWRINPPAMHQIDTKLTMIHPLGR